jgi:glucose-1-phosphate thymidylyltransferase
MPRKGVVVVPSGAQCKRMREDPPGTQRIANRPIIGHVVDALREAGAVELAIVASTGVATEVRAAIACDADRARTWGDVTFIPYGGSGDPPDALAAAASFVGGDACIVHWADGLVGQPLAPFTDLFEANDPELLLLVHSGADTSDRLGPDMQRLLGLAELNGARNRLGFAGICVFAPGVMEKANAETSDERPCLDVVAMADQLARTGGHLHVGQVRTWRRYSGNPADLLELNRLVLDQLTLQTEPARNGDNRVEGRVDIHPTAQVSGSVIVGPCIIGAGASVTSSYIGPYTSIGVNARIEGAEIERSIILDEARVMYVSGRIEASTVGRRASIFRDFGLPRAMRLHVGEDVEVALI